MTDVLAAILAALQLGKPVQLPPGTLLLVDDDVEPRAIVDVGDVTVMRTLGGEGPVAMAVDDGGGLPLWVLARQVQRIVSLPDGHNPDHLLQRGSMESELEAANALLELGAFIEPPVGAVVRVSKVTMGSGHDESVPLLVRDPPSGYGSRVGSIWVVAHGGRPGLADASYTLEVLELPPTAAPVGTWPRKLPLPDGSFWRWHVLGQDGRWTALPASGVRVARP